MATRANLACPDCSGKGVDAHGHSPCPNCGGDECGDCGGAGAPGGCAVCGKTATPAPRPRPVATTTGGKKRKAIIALVALVALAALGALAFGGWKLLKSSTPNMTTAPVSAPATTSSVNVDPTKPSPPTSATAVATAKKCPPGTLLDTERDVCVEKSSPPAIPSTITVQLPCPSNCPPPAPLASASAPPPAPTTTATATATASAPKPAPSFVPVYVDLTKIGDPAVFPGGK